MKRCGHCHEWKDESNFCKNKNYKDGLHNTCRQCVKEYKKEYHIISFVKRSIKGKEYRENNKEKIKIGKKNSEAKNPEKYVATRKEWIKNNKEKHIAYQKQYHIENRDRIKIINDVWRKNNKEKISKQKLEYEKDRLSHSPYLRFEKNFRGRVRDGIKEFSTNGKTKTCVEYGIDFKEIYENLGERPGSGKDWHLDHIIPLIVFNLDLYEHIYLSNYAENLRWLPAKENDSKADKIVWSLIDQSPKLLEIATLLGIKKEHDGIEGKVLRKLFYPALPELFEEVN